MRLKPPADIQVVKKEEKEAMLSAFVQRNMEERCNAGTDGAHGYTIVARSIDSPVVRALARHADEIREQGIDVRMVLTTIDFASAEPAPAAIDLSFAKGGIRVVDDPRLFEAHEQMTLGSTTVWVGDCLRREAAKRDAYERYCEDSAEAGVWAHAAFERLWATATPFRAPAAVAMHASFHGAATANVVMSEDKANAPTAMTRH